MKRFAAAGLAAALVAAGCAGSRQPDLAADEGDEPAGPREAAVKLPSLPKEEDLLRFEVRPQTALEYLVDSTSISLPDRDLVRFTVVARSSAAMNVSYEGFRCIARERKVYARASREGAWVTAKNAGWVPLGPRATAGFRHELFWNYFCPGKRTIASTGEGVDALRRGGHPDARPEGTLTE